ncbi:MAG: hypothetical protein LBR83_08120 [Clostridiales bacterium]|jgi:hypothetical protein|nr:hypothetical protein [Clostridiales bacterium]
MVHFIAGGKGEGKTKKLLNLANENARTTDGHLVFIDDDSRHIYDLDHDIRFVETGKHQLSNYREFVGFILGILSQDSDIKHIFVDGLTNIVETVDGESLVKLGNRLKQICEYNDVDFTISVNHSKETLPDEIKALLI